MTERLAARHQESPSYLQNSLFCCFLVGWLSYPYLVIDVGPLSLTFWHLFTLLAIPFSLRARPKVIIVGAGVFLSFLMAATVGVYYGSAPGSKILTHGIQTLMVLVSIIFFARYPIQSKVPQTILMFGTFIVLCYLFYQFIGRFLDWEFVFLEVHNQQISLKENADGKQRGYHLLGSRILELRPSSFFIEPGTLGYFGIAVFLMSGRNFLKTIAVIMIFMSFSLGAYFVFFVLMVASGLFRGRLFSMAVFAVLVLAAFFILDASSEFFRVNISDRVFRVFFDGGFSGEKRFSDLSASVSAFLQRPFFGFGLYGEIIHFEDLTLASLYQALLLERGIVGTLIFLLPILLVRFTTNNEQSQMLLTFFLVSILWKPYKFFLAAYMVIGIALYTGRQVNRDSKFSQQRSPSDTNKI